MIAYDSPAPTAMSPNCTHCDGAAKRFGKDRRGNQRFRCLTCRKTCSERPARQLGAMNLPVDPRALLCLHLLCEGSSRPRN